MNHKIAIHTTIPKNIHSELLRFGDGVLNDGIEKIYEIAISKQYNVKTELLRIADLIMLEKE